MNFIKERKVHAISYMRKENPNLDEHALEEIYRLSQKTWKWIFLIFFALSFLRNTIKGEIGPANALWLLIESAMWATIFYVIVIFLGKHSLEVKENALLAWHKIKKAFN